MLLTLYQMMSDIYDPQERSFSERILQSENSLCEGIVFERIKP